MVYLPNIPAAGDRPSQSQSQIQTNFQELNSQYGSAGDHVAFDAASNNGKHKKATILAGADPATAAGEGAVYVKDAGGGREELYYRRESSGAIIQLSVIKAWGSFNGGSGALTDSYNISSVVRNSAGNYTVNFINNLSNANYGVIVTPQMTAAFTTGGTFGIDGRAVNGFNIYTRSLTASSGVDLNPVSFIVLST